MKLYDSVAALAKTEHVSVVKKGAFAPRRIIGEIRNWSRLSPATLGLGRVVASSLRAAGRYLNWCRTPFATRSRTYHNCHTWFEAKGLWGRCPACGSRSVLTEANDRAHKPSILSRQWLSTKPLLSVTRYSKIPIAGISTLLRLGVGRLTVLHAVATAAVEKLVSSPAGAVLKRRTLTPAGHTPRDDQLRLEEQRREGFVAGGSAGSAEDWQREILCNKLKQVGVHASLEARGGPEEQISETPGYLLFKGFRSFGLIRIDESPIHLVNVMKQERNQFTGDFYRLVFFVPDPSVGFSLEVRFIRPSKQLQGHDQSFSLGDT